MTLLFLWKEYPNNPFIFSTVSHGTDRVFIPESFTMYMLLMV